eukprot:scaffold65433_cov66-Phaeocystis_antarctica.AAC.2
MRIYALPADVGDDHRDKRIGQHTRCAKTRGLEARKTVASAAAMVRVNHSVAVRHVHATHVRALLSERHACDVRKYLGNAIDLGRLRVPWHRVATRQANHGCHAVRVGTPLIGEDHIVQHAHALRYAVFVNGGKHPGEPVHAT